MSLIEDIRGRNNIKYIVSKWFEFINIIVRMSAGVETFPKIYFSINGRKVREGVDLAVYIC